MLSMIALKGVHASVPPYKLLQVEDDPDERDAETRVAAVKALALVAQKLFGGNSKDSTQAVDDSQSAARDSSPAADHHRQAADASVHPDPAAAVCLRKHVLQALLTAVEDYSTDNRSDSGFGSAALCCTAMLSESRQVCSHVEFMANLHQHLIQQNSTGFESCTKLLIATKLEILLPGVCGTSAAQCFSCTDAQTHDQT